MVYGALPPEMRRTQARLFNDPDSGYDILVASDAVGMGLNLNIRRIIFHTMEKTDGGGARVPISVSHIKQIAGAPALRVHPLYSSSIRLCRHDETVEMVCWHEMSKKISVCCFSLMMLNGVFCCVVALTYVHNRLMVTSDVLLSANRSSAL